MTYFVSEHTCQLGFIVDSGQQAASDIDIPSRSSKSVDNRRVHNLEPPIQGRTMRKPSHRLSHPFQVALQTGIIINAILIDDGFVRLLSQVGFILLAQQHQLLLSRNRVDRTADETRQNG